MSAELSVAVDRTSPVPLYYQVAQQLEAAIESGSLEAGARLDNELVLADQLGVSRPTMRRAIEYLVDRGYLVRRRGIGTQVVHSKVRRPVELTSLFDDLTLSGKDPRTDVLKLETEPAGDAVAEVLGVEPGDPIVVLERLRYAEGKPLAVMRNWIPPNLVVLDRPGLERSGLYRLMRAGGVQLRLASQIIGARSATAPEAKLLGAAKGEPLLTMTRTTYDESGRPVEHGDHFYLASRYSFEIALVTR